MIKRKARKSSGDWQLDGMWGQVGEEAACRRGQFLDAACQPISSHCRLHQAPDALDRVGSCAAYLGSQRTWTRGWARQPASAPPWRYGSAHCPAPDTAGRSDRLRQPLEKGDKMHGQLALMIGREPVPAHGIQRAEEGAAAVGTRGRDAPSRAFHPHRADQGQEMQVRLVQIQQMGQPLSWPARAA